MTQPGAVTGWRRLFVRKTIAELQADAATSTMRRTLSRTDLTILGVGAVIGSGIFVLPGIVAAHVAGPAVVLSLLIAGVVAMLAALCYAEFASLTSVSGSAYTYAYATMGEAFAWLIGWGLILEYTLGSAILALGWGSYVTGFMARVFNVPVATDMHAHIAGILATIGATIILCSGIRRSTYATAVFVLIKVAVIMLFIFFGVAFIEPANWHPFIPAAAEHGKYGWSGVLHGASIMFMAYIGFDAVTTAAQEARDPQRDVPAGVLGSLAISAVIYALLTLVLTGLVPYKKLGVPNPVAEAIHVTGVRWVGVAVELGAIAGLSSVLIVLLLAQARILLAMSRDGLLPRALSTINTKSGVPLVGTIVTGAVVALLSLLGTLDSYSELVNVGTFLAFIIVCIGIPILRHTDPDLPRGFRVPWSPFVPMLGALSCAYLIFALPPRTWMVAGAWFALGILIYAWQVVRRARVRA